MKPLLRQSTVLLSLMTCILAYLSLPALAGSSAELMFSTQDG
jgi:hypothetical protein